MAIGDKLFIADKATLDMVKTNTDTIKADSVLIKSTLATGAIYSDNLDTQISDNSNLVVNLTGKYELLALSGVVSGATAFTIQIDGNVNRKVVYVTNYAITNLSGLGIKCNSTMKIYSNNIGCKAIYRLIP